MILLMQKKSRTLQVIFLKSKIFLKHSTTFRAGVQCFTWGESTDENGQMNETCDLTMVGEKINFSDHFLNSYFMTKKRSLHPLK